MCYPFQTIKRPVLSKLLLLLLAGCMTAALARAQSDPWTGSWQMIRKPWTGSSTPLVMDLQIGVPDNGQLYPAKITLQYGEFKGVYEMLLVRKNDGQLGISRGKYPLQEKPFKLGIWMWYINGCFDLRNKQLVLNRKWIDKADFWMRGLYDDDDIWVQSKVNLRDFLYRDSIFLKKLNNQPLVDSSVRRILQPPTSGIYLGIYDPIVTTDSLALMKLEDQEKYDKDTVTLLHNGKPLLYRDEVNDHNRALQARLDTGRNLFIFLPTTMAAFRPIPVSCT